MRRFADTRGAFPSRTEDVGICLPAQPTNPKTMNIIRKLAVTAVLTASIVPSFAALQWGGGGSSLNWSDGNNWNNFPNAPWGSPPTSSDTVYFEDFLYPNAPTNVPSAVNNIVDTSRTIGSLNYTALSTPAIGSTLPATNHYYTTLIPFGNTLTVGGLNSGAPVLVVGDVPGTHAWITTGSWTNGTTITGPGTLTLSDTTANMSLSLRGLGANLNMIGLSNFNATVNQVLIGASADNIVAQAGNLWLAQSNFIVTTPNLSAPGILMGYNPITASGNGAGNIFMGSDNIFYSDGLVVGGFRSVSGTTALKFNNINPGAINNLILRGSAGGSSRTATFSVGDMSAEIADYNGSAGVSCGAFADFTGGSVDILANNIYVGRSTADSSSLANGGGNTQVGVANLIVESGTVDVNNLFVAFKQGTNSTSAGTATTPSALLLKSNAVMTVNNNLAIGLRFYAGDTNGPAPSGIVIVSNTAVLNVGGNITTSTNGISQLFLAGGTVNMTGGNVTISNLIGSGSIAGSANVTVYNVLAPGGSKAASPGGLIGGGTVSGIGTLNLDGNLFLTNAQPITFDLGPTNTAGSGVNDYLNVGGDLNFNNNPVFLTFNGPLLAGSNYTLVSFGGALNGSLVFTNPTRSSLSLIQTTPNIVLKANTWTPATLTWVGTNVLLANNTNVWDGSNFYWTNKIAGTNDHFFQGDAVVIDDTATNPIIWPNGTLYPASINISNNLNAVRFTNNLSSFPGLVGSIAGNCSITKDGTNLFAMSMLSNSFSGPININNGTFQIVDISASGASGATILGSTNGTLFINNGATFDTRGQTLPFSPGKQVVITGNGFNGNGVVANSGTSRTRFPFVVTLTGPSLIVPGVGDIGFCSASGKTVSTASGTPPFSGAFHLNGNTLTIVTTNGTSKAFILQDMLANDNGSINVGTNCYLALIDTILGGTTGAVTFSNNTSLAFGFAGSDGSYTLSSNLLTKPLVFYDAAIEAPYRNTSLPLPTVPAPAATAIINSTVSLVGDQNLVVTNYTGVTINGVISGNTGIGITKYGTGILTLNNADTYSGTTLVTAGTLALGSSGSIAGSPAITINPGATLDVSANPSGMVLANGQFLNMGGTTVGNLTAGTGSTLIGSGPINGSLIIQSNALVAPQGTNDTGHFIVNGNLALNGGQFNWEVGPSFAASDAFEVSSNLTLTGTNVFTISSIGGFSPNNTNTLLTYGGLLTGTTNNIKVLTEPNARFVVKLVDPATTQGKIQIVLVTPSPLLTWAGGFSPNPNAWDIRTTTNWLNGLTNDLFYSADLVRFDDTANTNVVNLTTSVGPGWMSMENSSKSYVFNGPGRIVTSTLTNYTGSVTFSNLGNTIISGSGISINGGTVTFAQPTNAILTASLIGSGNFTKAGSSNLTLVADDSSLFNGAVSVAGGTLTAGSTNCFGTGTVTVQTGASLDLNGKPLTANAMIHAQGIGADSNGAINNRGTALTNQALANVTLDNDTTLGSISNSWAISQSLAGGGFALTKTNGNDVWILTGGETDLGNIIAGSGRLIFSQPGTTLGRSASNIVVRANATLGLATTNVPRNSGLPLTHDWGSKSIFLTNNGAAIESVNAGAIANTNILGSSIFVTNANPFFMRVAQSSTLILNGPISGPGGQLILTNGGALQLNGTNTYTSNTIVYGGFLYLTNSLSLPTNTWLILSNVVNSVGAPNATFAGSQTFSNRLQVGSWVGAATVQGDAIWGGPINLSGSNGISFFGGSNLLYLAGPITSTNASGLPTVGSPGAVIGGGAQAAIAFHGMNTRIASPIKLGSFTAGSTLPNVTIGQGDGEARGFNENFTTVELDSPNNWTCIWTFERGQAILGADNALGTNVGIANVGTLSSGVSDRRVIIDLNGHNQSVSYMREAATLSLINTIGNSSTNADSTFTYAGTGTNVWNFNITDTLGTPATPHKVGLSVTSGFLELINSNLYSGPTTVSGGTLLVSTYVAGIIIFSTNTGTLLNPTPVTVSGTGSFGGNSFVGGSVTINAGGTLLPGDVYDFGRPSQGAPNPATGVFPITNSLVSKIGTLTMGGSNLTFNAGATGVFDVDNVHGTNDSVAGIGTVAYGGTLIISDINNQPFVNGQVIKLFNASSYTGSFANIVFSPGVDSYDASNLTVDGTIKVVTTPSTTPVPITATKVGGSLQLSWPADHTGWRLQTQTNILKVGLTTNWFSVAGSQTTNQITVPIVNTNPTVFYRLTYP
jgi:autotransporter-associated beta strand protein